eukprot:gnl/Chilomastix_cuspidata/50.p2 GENE.gnl/Chilomastix_cuspidata/50~~gnl/Chilomastix_cuspidata/50.p2  ORF type:complete len:711 (-),score=399.91 gnl/Chilomastix_cuspidata/50:1208-3340(-)
MGKLSFFLKPASIAIIGASAATNKVGFTVLNNILTSGYEGVVYPINPRTPEILGHKAYKSVLDVEGEIDLAIMCVPSRFVPGAAEECGKKGVKGIICITAGFREVGGAGIELEHKLVETTKKYGTRLLGPNVLGIINGTANMSFAAKNPKRGRIAMLSQSGAMLTAILDWADTQDIGFSNFISLGNKADVDAVDFIEEIAEDPETSVMCLYLESVEDGDKFMRVVSKATEKKPVIILKSGTSQAGKAAASSHTGALAGDDMSFDLAFEKAGVIRAITMNELFDLATLFDRVTPPKSSKFTIITNAGGPGIVATDAFEHAGVEFTRYSPEFAERLTAVLPGEASIKNPVDIVGDAPPKRYYDALDISFQAPVEECAGALVLVTPQAQTNPPEVAKVCVEIQEKYPDRLVVACFMGGSSMIEPTAILDKARIPCYPFPEPSIKAIAEMLRYKSLVSDKVAPVVPSFDVDNERIKDIFAAARADGRKVLMPAEASEIFTMFKISSPVTKLAFTSDEAFSLSKEVGFPVVMKIVSPDIMHKSDCGGVKLFIKSQDEAKAAFDEIMVNVKANGPEGARIKGVEIQEMVDFKAFKKTSEVIVGMNRDPQWGPLLMVGQGGIYANYLKDVAFQMALGYTADAALRQLQRTKIYSILEGVRGEPRSDIEGLIDCMLKLAQLVRDFPEIKELDMNPLLVFEQAAGRPGYSAIDIKILLE